MTITLPVERLAPLFNPKSIAVIGASGRVDRPGYDTLAKAYSLGWAGEIFPVTPNYSEICSLPCFTDISEIENDIDLTIIAGSPKRLEEDLLKTIDAGTRSVIIYGNPLVTDDPGLGNRLQAITKEADIPMLGPNSIGYVNYSQKTVASWIPPTVMPCGNVAGIIQSGTVFGSCTLTDPRVRFCLAVHPGQETSVSSASMINYALTLPETRVIALYLEIIYDHEGFVEALERAEKSNIPVVALKPGRSIESQSAIATHTGRMVAEDNIIDAVLRKYNVIRVQNTDEWWTTLCLFSHTPQIGPGNLSIIGDSGGMKALMLDEAKTIDVPLSRFSQSTKDKLRDRLAPDLRTENPVDYWGGEEKLADHVAGCLSIVSKDPDTAVSICMGEMGSIDSDAFTNNVADGIIAAHRDSEKPVLAGSYSSRQFWSKRISRLTDNNIAVLDGITNMLYAFKYAFLHRDRIQQARETNFDHNILSENLSESLDSARSGLEIDALGLLSEAGISSISSDPVNCEKDIQAISVDIQWPVAMKTSEGVQHKSECHGVVLDIKNKEELISEYQIMSDNLGPRVIVQPMAPKGLEIAMGMINDPNYGPVIMLASGGVNVELSRDKIFVLCPLTRTEAVEMVNQLHCKTHLDGYRGSPALDQESLIQTLLSFSALSMATQQHISSIDINPLIVHEQGTVAVDALVQFRT